MVPSPDGDIKVAEWDKFIDPNNRESAFYTDLELEENKDQITEYANALKLMGKTNIDRILIYISDVIKVVRL